jgi:YD repeat-containing protein
VTYNYDSMASGNFGVGRLTQVTEAAASGAVLQNTDYRYDRHGRLLQESRTLNNIAYVTSYRYDSAGRLDRITYPSGRQVNYTLDGVGRIAEITTTKDGATQTVLNKALYRPFGPVKEFDFGNGQNYKRDYDLDGRITSYSQANLSVTVGYDPASRITRLGAYNYDYDEIDRLTGARDLPGGKQTFAYDKVGNRVSKIVGANNETYTFSDTSSRLDRITGANARSFTHDDNGSMIAAGANTFSYDARGRMTGSTGTLGASIYQVNSQGQRVRKSGAGGDTIYHYDAQGRLIAETGSNGTLQKEYIYLGDLPVAVIQ